MYFTVVECNVSFIIYIIEFNCVGHLVNAIFTYKSSLWLHNKFFRYDIFCLDPQLCCVCILYSTLGRNNIVVRKWYFSIFRVRIWISWLIVKVAFGLFFSSHCRGLLLVINKEWIAKVSTLWVSPFGTTEGGGWNLGVWLMERCCG